MASRQCTCCHSHGAPKTTTTVHMQRTRSRPTEKHPSRGSVTLFGIKDDDVSELEDKLAAGADVDERGAFGRTPLMQYCCDLAKSSCPNILRRLAGVSDVNAMDSDGNTALHLTVLAASYGYDTAHRATALSAAVVTLRDAGAHLGARNKAGKTPKQLAQRHRQTLTDLEKLELSMKLEQYL